MATQISVEISAYQRAIPFAPTLPTRYHHPPMTDFLPGFRGRDRYGGYVVLAADGDARLVRYDDGREAHRSVVLLRLAHSNREFDADRAPVAPPPPATPRRKAARRPADDETTFSQQDTEPLIAALIRQLTGDPPDYVTHDALVAALLADPAGRRLIARARELQGDDRSREAIAANMVAWFSQRITTRLSPYTRDFDRRKQAGAWAYRPR